jgi:para-aminobenzoate synthetase/4-amino-4-deoxychorismate lyase
MTKLRAILEFPLDGNPSRPLHFGDGGEILCATNLHEVCGVLARAQQRAEAGAWVVGFVSYEAAPAFDGALRARPPGNLPLAWFTVHDAPMPAPSLRRGTGAGDPGGREGRWTPALSREEYRQDFRRIHEAIGNGVAYQVNLTFPLSGVVEGEPVDLFRRLRAAQPGGYRAFLDLGSHQVLSLSPELFFSRSGSSITTRPMKGTAPRGADALQDEAIARGLRESEKDRAENLMIVDLLRNDLSRIAVTGSVRVPELFAVERHPTLHQMTSTVTASLHPGTTLVDIFRATFPCGSVTGAPKAKAMQIIAEIEAWPRGAYCGAVGVVRPGGDAMFNVGIRTLTVDARTRAATYPVGGGIVWDSRDDAEYAEALLKARVLGRENET